MPDRFSLPDDRRDSCHACGSEKREELAECWNCEASICSECGVKDQSIGWELVCRKCSRKWLNEVLAEFVPVCRCTEWPSWVNYGHQLSITEAA